ncbi:MAG: histidine phosphatase family protein [Verrucomicrobia bacterium]|jgi:broad specificity phosphatase PhoE|nr:histidine phosphatase family protein [Verrucomicrobiota bacterium]
MPTTRLLLIRHAEVEARYQKIFGGRIDMELSPQGHTQAQALCNYLRRKTIDAIYASPMKRVQLTLAPFLNNGAPQPVIMSGLREVDFGDWTGHGWDGVKEKFGANAFEWLHHLERGTIPNAEPLAIYHARVEPCLREIVERHPGQRVAVFCHGGVIRMLLAILLDLPLSKMSAFEIDYASISEIELQPHRMEIQLLNFAPWRDLAPQQPT